MPLRHFRQEGQMRGAVWRWSAGPNGKGRGGAGRRRTTQQACAQQARAMRLCFNMIRNSSDCRSASRREDGGRVRNGVAIVPAPRDKQICAEGSLSLPLDLDAHAAGVLDDVRLFDPHPRGHHALVAQAGGGDLLAQRLDQVDVALGDDGLDLLHHDLVGDDMADVVVLRAVALLHREVDVDDDALRVALFVLVDADQRHQVEIAHEDMAEPRRGTRHVVADHRLLHSFTSITSGVCQTRCCPPSSAIICPVSDGCDNMNLTAAEISAGDVPRPRSVSLACLSNSAWSMRAEGSAGPGPMALTRMLGRQRLGQRAGGRPQAGLRRRVGEELRVQLPHALVDDRDDVAFLARRQLPGEGLATGRRAPADWCRGARPSSPCVMDPTSSGSNSEALLMRQVRPPRPVRGLRDQPVRHIVMGEVAAHDDGALADVADEARHLLGLGDRGVAVDGDVPAVLGEVERQPAPDALGGTGDENGFLHGSCFGIRMT